MTMPKAAAVALVGLLLLSSCCVERAVGQLSKPQTGKILIQDCTPGESDVGLARMSRKMLRDNSGGSGSFSGGFDYSGYGVAISDSNAFTRDSGSGSFGFGGYGVAFTDAYAYVVG